MKGGEDARVDGCLALLIPFEDDLSGRTIYACKLR